MMNQCNHYKRYVYSNQAQKTNLNQQILQFSTVQEKNEKNQVVLKLALDFRCEPEKSGFSGQASANRFLRGPTRLITKIHSLLAVYN